MNEAEVNAGLAPTPGYRYADRLGARLFVAGQVPLDESGLLVGAGDRVAQVRQCLANLGTLLAVHGFGPADIRQIKIHVVGDQQDLGTAWNAVVEHFGGEAPPATLLGAAGLGHEGQLVEIDANVAAAETGGPGP